MLRSPHKRAARGPSWCTQPARSPELVHPLKSHGRYPYSPITRRPDYRWPNGSRLAVYLGFNIEHFEFGQGLGAALGPRRTPAAWPSSSQAHHGGVADEFEHGVGDRHGRMMA